LASAVLAQTNVPYCDSSSGICFQGYTDPDMNITMGLVFPPLTSTPSNEYIIQLVAPVSYGWTGFSAGGSMADSLLFTLWPYNNKVMLGARWTSEYTLPTAYSGPQITLLPDSTVNSTHIKATFRCQNCTVWQGGSTGNGNLSGFQLLAYVVSYTTQVTDPSDISSSLQEHDDFNFFGLDLSTAHDSNYNSYIGESTTTITNPITPTPSPTTTTLPPITTTPTTTIGAPKQTETQWGQCGGIGWSGPTACAPESTCTILNSYYSQCIPS